MTNENKARIKLAVHTILDAIGEDLNREGIKYTPERVARLFESLFYGYTKKLIIIDEVKRNSGKLDSNEIPITIFKSESNDMLIRKVKFVSMCEHHLAAITNGECWVGIIPGKHFLGMNKIDKIVKYFAARLQIQERLTHQVAEWIFKNIEPGGVIVVIKANHMCAEFQGDEGHFITSAVKGLFATDAKAKEEFLQLIKRST